MNTKEKAIYLKSVFGEYWLDVKTELKKLKV